MIIHFNRKDFLRLFRYVASVASTRDVKPILQNVKITANKKDGAYLQATDTQTSIKIFVDCTVDAKGKCLVPAKKLVKILESSREAQLTLESNENGIVLSSGSERYEFGEADPDEFPNVRISDDADNFRTVMASDLTKAVKRTVVAVSKDVLQKPALTGVCFNIDGDHVNMIATDGKILSWQKIICYFNRDNIELAIVPVPALKLLAKILQDKSLKELDQVKIQIAKHQAFFQCCNDKITVCTRLIEEGKFPSGWQIIVPKADMMHCAKVTESKELLAAFKSILQVLDNRDKEVNLSFNHNSLTISAFEKASGNSTMVVPVECDCTATMTIKAKNVIDCLMSLEKDANLRWYIPDGVDTLPTMIRNEIDDGYTCVIFVSVADSSVIPAAEAERERIRKEEV